MGNPNGYGPMRLIVTAGPTREYLDAVRFLSNASSGKMGFAIAAEAARRGHQVTLISGPVSLYTPEGVERINVVSAQDMLEEVTAAFSECHCVVMASAVGDYRPVRRADSKIAKAEHATSVELEPTTDILAHLGRLRSHQVLIGFALEDHQHHAHAESKLKRKGCDAIVLNTPENLGSDQGTIEIYRPGTGWSPCQTGTKQELACSVLDLAEELVGLR